jgi:calcineurin-like phosphoesterase family protein
MTDYVTSDLHFWHTNIMKFCPVTRARYNNDVVYMNEAMIEEWNAIIKPGDRTYILGDVCFASWEKAVAILKRLNGSKILVAGNHDKKLLKSKEFRDQFESIHDYLDINVNGTKVVMFHYPIAEWDQMHRGAVHLHGHLHGGHSGLEQYRVRDAGMDAHGMIARRLESIVAEALRGEIKGHHQKGN